MRKIVSCLLVLVFVLCGIPSAFAEMKDKPLYASLPVEYSNALGSQKFLSVMCKNTHLYVEATALAAGLGYKVKIQDERVVIYNNEEDNASVPYGIIGFYYDSRQVVRMNGYYAEQNYQAPFETVKNENGVWIPLAYGLLALQSSGLMMQDGTLCIALPQITALDVILQASRKFEKYLFDWNKDFGYAEWEQTGKLLASKLVNFGNGLLALDGAAWDTFFNYAATQKNSSAYDRKYAEALAILFCTNSAQELEALNQSVEAVNDAFMPNGKLGTLLNDIDDYTDENVGLRYRECKEVLSKLKQGNSSVADYNKAYRQMEKAFGTQSTFNETTEVLRNTQAGLEKATTVTEIAGKAVTVLDVITTAIQVIGYLDEFKNADRYGVAALESFLQTASAQNAKPMADAMNQYLKKIQSNVVDYGVYRYVKENYSDWLKDAIRFSKRLAADASIALSVWELSSTFIPYISGGLSAADKYELATYATMEENYAYVNFTALCNNNLRQQTEIKKEGVNRAAQACYTYLKFSYICREAALISINQANQPQSVQTAIQPLIDSQNQINSEIAKLLAILKTVDSDNKGGELGFLLENSKAYCRDSSDEKWLDLIEFQESPVPVGPESNTNTDILLRVDRQYYIDGIPQTVEELLFTYDEQGRIICEPNLDMNGSAYGYTQYEYGVDGKKVKGTELDDSKKPTGTTITYEYDVKGRVIKEIYTDPSLGLIEELHGIWGGVEYKYDENDRLIWYKEWSIHSALEISYEYDENGRLVQGIGKGVDGQFVISFIYNADGKLIQQLSQTSMRDQGEFELASSQDIAYDMQGRLHSVTYSTDLDGRQQIYSKETYIYIN